MGFWHAPPEIFRIAFGAFLGTVLLFLTRIVVSIILFSKIQWEGGCSPPNAPMVIIVVL